MASAESVKTLGEVLAELLERELLDAEGLSLIKQHLAKRESHHHEPWFVKFLLALGAWIAAICFVTCLGIANLIGDDWRILFLWGGVFIVSATVLRRFSDHIFPIQLALAVSSMGHGLVIAGAANFSGGDRPFAYIATASVGLCLVLYFIYPDNLHRFLSCLVAAGLLAAWIVESDFWPLLHLAILAKVVTIGIVFTYRPEPFILRPLGYAMAIALSASLFLVLLPEGIEGIQWWPANVILTAALVWLFQWVAGGWDRLRSEPLMIVVASTVCLAAFTTPGILAALGLMVLGYARHDRYLLAMGVLFFPIFIVVFYYEWQISLLTKSCIMAGSGATLLLARWFLSLRGWAKE